MLAADLSIVYLNDLQGDLEILAITLLFIYVFWFFSVEAIQNSIQLFTDHYHSNHATLTRQESVSSMGSQTSGIGENTVTSITNGIIYMYITSVLLRRLYKSPC